MYIYLYKKLWRSIFNCTIIQLYSYTSYTDKYRPPLSLGLALYKGFREKLKNSILFCFRQAVRIQTKRLRSNCMSPWLSRWNFATCQGRLVTCGTKMWPTRPVTVAEWNFVGADLPIESLRWEQHAPDGSRLYFYHSYITKHFRYLKRRYSTHL